MNKDEVQSKIENFVGDLTNTYLMVNSICNELNIDFSNIFDTSNPESKFITFVRHLITKSVISRPKKTGRSLLLNGRNLLDILVAKKYLNTGLTINHLNNAYIATLSTKELYERLFADQLTDIAHMQNVRSISDLYSSKIIEGGSILGDPSIQDDYEVFKRFKINDDMELNVLSGKYSVETMKKIQNYLKRIPKQELNFGCSHEKTEKK